MFSLGVLQIRREFKATVPIEGNVKEIITINWPVWKAKVIELSRVECKTRPYIKKLLGILDNCDGSARPDGG